MSWNYRVMRSTQPDGTPWLEVREVYYGDNGEPRACTENAAGVGGDTLEELGAVLDRMRRALGEPVLEPGDFPDEALGPDQGREPGWAEAVTTPDEDVGYVFTPLSADFTGLPVDVAVGDDTPLVIAAPKTLGRDIVAAVRHWVVRQQAALTAHWRDEIGSAELCERLRRLP